MIPVVIVTSDSLKMSRLWDVENKSWVRWDGTSGNPEFGNSIARFLSSGDAKDFAKSHGLQVQLSS